MDSILKPWYEESAENNSGKIMGRKKNMIQVSVSRKKRIPDQLHPK